MWRNRMPDLEVEEICTEANLSNVTQTQCAGTRKTTNIRSIRRNSRSSQGQRTLEFLLVRYEELRGVHEVDRELLKGRGH